MEHAFTLHAPIERVKMNTIDRRPLSAFAASPARMALLLLIILFGAALRVYCFHGFVGLDDAEYARFAHQMARGSFTVGTYEGPAVFPLRIGLIYPVSVLFRLFGVGEWSMLLYPLTLSVLSIALAYFAAAYFFGGKAGFAAAALWAVLPLDVENATKLVPDLPAAFYASAGLIIILYLMRLKTERKLPLFLGGAAAGLAFGLSWLCKETVAYVVPFVFVVFVISLRADRKNAAPLWIGAAVASFCVLFGEMAFYHHRTGDWLFRFHEVERNYLQWKNGFFTEGSDFGWSAGNGYGKALAKRLLLTGPATIFLNVHFLFMPLFGLLAAFHALIWKEKSFLLPALWLGTLAAMFNFSSSSFSSYTPLTLFNRYLYPICLPAVVLTAGLVEALVAKSRGVIGPVYRERLFWGIVLTSVLALLGGYLAFRMVRDTGSAQAWTAEVRRVSGTIKPMDRVFTDSIARRGLEFFWRYPEEMNLADFEKLSGVQIPAGSYVLTNSRYADWLVKNAGMWLSSTPDYRRPDFIDHPPASWKVVWKNGNAALYRVESR